ncbi:MAG: isoaspartyl peptidase/L-asparaginase [bacterium]
MTYTILVHGGAGAVQVEALKPAERRRREAALRGALEAGGAILAAGGPALDAAQAAVLVLEDHPDFNAGRGAVLTTDGRVELDAAVMDGATGRAGAVASVRRLKNPILGARAVLEASPHVLLVGAGAERFCLDQGLERAPPRWFRTAHRVRQLEALRAIGGLALDHGGSADGKHGTVGAVALDLRGHLAAATSTGGIANKRHGRVGDSPLIGAGTYADGRVAVSCTGQGEAFIRAVAAHALAARVRFLGQGVEDAAAAVLAEISAQGAEGGLIALDAAGRATLPFTTAGMYRGWLRAGEVAQVAIGP